LKYMSKLKFHEKKLRKKVNFIEYKREGGHREALVTRRYHLSERDDYKKYPVLVPFQFLQQALFFCYNMGVISTTKILTKCDKLSVSSFCRLATVLVYLKFAEHLREAVTYIEQGLLWVGPDVVTDPAFLVMRNMEDFVTWVDSSKIKRKVME
ncbi:hypothetical protein B296_00003972, partial [Ensete ventricosum]